MSNKIKSSLYLSCFILTFTIYTVSIDNSKNNYDNSPEIAVAEFNQESPMNYLQFEETK
ncbi:hypothetical protein JQC67_07195 [Aurantibacter crassamenti]|uniref:hypothetical protein n=1 Tax=Aurantibacter crassamenti TaxID=1837375 RepID=UPI00193AD246|nr:hypothetical protein [Aurantibacter crassamenti]MBM1105916.1 hypothetical protein [Aurantibacter crassamenti]